MPEAYAKGITMADDDLAFVPMSFVSTTRCITLSAKVLSNKKLSMSGQGGG